MSDSVFIQSLLAQSVVDVQGAKAVAGTLLDAYPIKFTPSTTPPTPNQLSNAANQLWQFVAGPLPGSFFIESQLGSDLVIDIQGGKAVSGAPVQIYPKKAASDAKSQLWTLLWVFEPTLPGQLRGFGYLMIQSVLDSNLVVDITGASAEPGTLLQVYAKKPTGRMEDFNNAKNQLWSQTPTTLQNPK
jgi:ricin-type beta-trefoil lectin protein